MYAQRLNILKHVLLYLSTHSSGHPLPSHIANTLRNKDDWDPHWFAARKASTFVTLSRLLLPSGERKRRALRGEHLNNVGPKTFTERENDVVMMLL